MNKSEQLNELFAALSKAHEEMPAAGLNSSNSFLKSKYANLADIMKAARPALCKNGLVVSQYMEPNEHGVNTLVTVLGHTSGQFIESRILLSVERNEKGSELQAMGKSITYLRRYAYTALVGIIISDDPDDDDGEHTRSYQPKPQYNAGITRQDRMRLESELDGLPDIKKAIIERYGSLDDIPKAHLESILNKIKETKGNK